MANTLAGREEMEQPETMVHHLRRNGYYTVGIGKISHSADGFVYGYEEAVSEKLELPHSWDERLFDHGKWETGWNAFFGYADGGNRQGKLKQVKPYEKGRVDDEGYPDGLTTNLALKKLKELKDNPKPFFLGVGLFKPHLPFTAPEKYWDMYEENAIPLPLVDTLPKGASPASLQQNGEFNQYALGEEKATLDSSMSEGYIRKLKHAYFGCVSYADAQIGLILEELEQQGLAENTIVVIWGDHGWHLGDQRVWGKHTLSEYALRSAFLMRVPQLQERGVEIKSVVESVDIFPTLLELCDVGLPDIELDGSSFVDRMISPTEEVSDVAYSYWKNGFSVRTDSFRLSKYVRDEEPAIELYNYRDDPAESKNVALQNPDVVTRLMQVLDAGDYPMR